MSTPPEPSETAKVATQGCSLLLWIGGAFLVLMVLGAVVRGCTGGDGPPPPVVVETEAGTTSVPFQRVSRATEQCLDERFDGRHDEVVTRMYTHPDDPTNTINWELMYGCFTDEEAERLYPEAFALYPPSYTRCAEDALGWDAFVEEVTLLINEPDYLGDDVWLDCLHLAPNL